MFKKLFGAKKETGPMGPVQYIIAGLGNPGGKFEGTRHNAGFMALDLLASRCACRVDRLKFKSLCGETVVAGHKVLLMKPSNFMNRSGESVREAMGFYKIPPEQVLVIFDDASLPLGTMRIRRSGRDGGHNGMKNIIYLTGTDTFPRIKIGVGNRPHPDYDLADWVLSRFSTAEQKALLPVLNSVPEAVEMILSGDIEKAMGKFN